MGKLSRHHLIPVSKKGRHLKNNIILVNTKKHQAYHTLFQNALPEEAVMILVRDWFHLNRKRKIDALRKIIKELSKILTQTVEE